MVKDFHSLTFNFFKNLAQRNAKNVSATPRNLWGPNAWRTDIKLRSVHSFCGAAHSVIVTEDYKAYVFGRNDKNQLGFPDTDTRHEPVLLESLSKYKVLSAAVGRNHTLFLTDNGVYSCGDNKLGIVCDLCVRLPKANEI